jgi:hypothetical protein
LPARSRAPVNFGCSAVEVLDHSAFVNAPRAMPSQCALDTPIRNQPHRAQMYNTGKPALPEPAAIASA